MRSARRTTADRMAAHRKSDRRRDVRLYLHDLLKKSPLLELALVLVRFEHVASFTLDDLGASDLYLYINQACCLIANGLDADLGQLCSGENSRPSHHRCGGRYFFDHKIGCIRLRALDAKLDAFAAMLKERRPVAGQG